MTSEAPSGGDGPPRSGEVRAGDEASPAAAGEPPAHRHAWRGVEFFFRDDRPWFRMACGCGAEREIRAWERYWQPGEVTGTE